MSSAFSHQLDEIEKATSLLRYHEPPTTAVEPFAPTVERKELKQYETDSYQSISFQDSYKNWSPEEVQQSARNQGLDNRTHNQARAGGPSAPPAGTGGNTPPATEQRFTL